MKIHGLHLTQIGHQEFLLEPSLGLDVAQPDSVLQDIMSALLAQHATTLFYDLSELPLIDRVYYNWLDVLARYLSTINVKLVAVNMLPTAAYGLSVLLSASPLFDTALSIQAWRERWDHSA